MTLSYNDDFSFYESDNNLIQIMVHWRISK